MIEGMVVRSGHGCIARSMVVAVAGLLLALAGHGRLCWAKVELAGVFGDQMVLQADMPVAVWGTARPGESISITVGAANRQAIADAKGQWRVIFDPLRATSQPVEFQVVGDNAVQLRNVVVGEVWFAAGQSNMEWPLVRTTNSSEALRSATEPSLRLLRLQASAHTGGGAWSEQELSDVACRVLVNHQWQPSTPQSAAAFSAVGYHFGRELHERLEVPVGIIACAVGGTPTESWIRSEALRRSPRLAPLAESNWLENSLLGEWCRQRARENLSLASRDLTTLPADPADPPHPFQPSYMWDVGVFPLTQVGLRGVIWYQGESNADSPARVQQHTALFETLVADWRLHFRRSDLPMLFVQLPALGRPDWPEFRQCQLECMQSIDHTGMVVTIDQGHPTDVHPREKREVGGRLALLAADMVYGNNPRTRSVGGTAVTAYWEEELTCITFENVRGNLKSKDGQRIRHFELAGRRREFVPAVAKVNGSCVYIASEAISRPRFVRYAWSPFPTPPVNLVDEGGFPVSPFELSVSTGGAAQ